MIEVRKNKEKAVVIGVSTADIPFRKANIHLDELSRLAETAGAEVVARILQRRQMLDGSTIIGHGKLEEVAAEVSTHEADMVIFDHDLSGSQVKKIESIIPVKVLDRSGIILDIFARNAKTAEAKIQVEVAQLEYTLPRLTRAWTHLCRQVGGIGTRGPGETQLEVDRRTIRKRIADLKKRQKKNEAIKQRQHDRRYPIFHTAVVGYTNAGKSSLMNLMTKSDIKVENKLFATLDATTRKLILGHEGSSVMSDTVGFIRKLPHNLIESFKSTLSVVSEATLVLHIIDADDPDFKEHMEVTAQVLKELCTISTPRIEVFNKIDLLDEERIINLRANFPDAIFISVHDKAGLGRLKSRMRRYYRRHLLKFSRPGFNPVLY